MTEGIVAVTSMIICGMEKTASPTDFIPDAMEIIFMKSSGIADETEIITDEASINLSGLEMIEAISVRSMVCFVPLRSRRPKRHPVFHPKRDERLLVLQRSKVKGGLCKLSLLGDCRFWATEFINCLTNMLQGNLAF